MAFSRSLLSGFHFLFFVLLLNLQGLLGCFFAPGDSRRPAAEHAHALHKRKKISPSYPNTLPVPAAPPPDDHGCRRHGRAFLSLASIRSCFASAFSSGNHCTASINREQSALTLGAAAAALCAPSPLPMTTQSLFHSHLATNANILLGAAAAADIRKHSFPSRTDIFPCTSCGEVFSKAHLLDLHQAMKHSLSELSVSEADSGLNIVRIIFLSCWKGSCAPTVCRIFKIHHSQRALAHFEEYRDVIRSRASRHCGAIASTMDERCIADGNERLRFYCSTMLCSLSAGGVCRSPYCCTCEILQHGFSGKQADIAGITTYSSGWGAHSSLPEEVEKEFSFLQMRRAMLVCRVVAGRVAHGGAAELMDVRLRGAAAACMFESVALPTNSGDDELIVFNPKAMLPCFVILYSSSLLG